MNLFLIFASLALLGVIAAQDYLYAPFRSETISEGLNGPGHVALDGAYLILAAALILGFHGIAGWFALIGAAALVASGVCNTAWRWVDGLTGKPRGHEVWHLRFTYVVFGATALVQVTSDHGWLWYLSGANLIVPAAMWFATKRIDYTEKVGVLFLNVWLIAWAL